MALETFVTQKMITDDGKNGLPVRLFDSSGNAVTNANPQAIKLVDANGNPLSTAANPLLTALSPQQTIVVPSRTDTTSFTTADLTAPPGQFYVFAIHVTAVSGTSPSMTVTVAGKMLDGSYFGGLGANSSAITAAGLTVVYIGTQLTSGSALLLPTYHIACTITGTTPSFTYTIEMAWK